MQESVSVRGKSLGRHLLHGSFWMIATRWGLRLTGVVSTFVLARLLAPADFGIVAMAMIFVGMLEVVNQTGQKLVIIRHPNPVREDYDTCWTISILIGLGIGVAIVLLAPVSEWYFRDPRAVPVMRWLALRAALGGFENVGVLDFRRNLAFDRLFRYSLYPKLVTFCVTIPLAFALRNYWALVCGMIIMVVATDVLSFVMHPYRPRLSLSKLKEMWSFSMWTFVRIVGWYLNFQVDLFAIGGIAGAASMGRYSVASDVASSPSMELNGPVIAALYPVMSKLQQDTPRLRELYLKVLGWSAIICAAAGVGVTLVAHDMVQVLLGAKWMSVVPLIGWLALSAGILGLTSCAYTAFDALGIPELGARLQWVRLTMLCLAIAPVAFFTRNLELVAATRFAATLIFMPTLFLTAARTLHASPVDYVRVLWRPLAAAAMMAILVSLINASGMQGGPLRLIIDIFAGAMAFAASLYLFWWLNGRPESPESDALAFVKAGVARQLGRADAPLTPASGPIRE